MLPGPEEEDPRARGARDQHLHPKNTPFRFERPRAIISAIFALTTFTLAMMSLSSSSPLPSKRSGSPK
jgi:hypothetical protein